MARRNLFLGVEQKAGQNMANGQFLSAVHSAQKPCLVFLNSQQRCESMAQLIMMQHPQLRVTAFHSRMSEQRKGAVLRDARQSMLDVLCCTIAFGMGVDVPVRTVIHWELPMNMESYVQAIGRAGRDGFVAQCTVFWNAVDLESLHARVRRQGIAVERRAADVLVVESYCVSSRCRHRLILEHFASREQLDDCTSCDNCMLAGR